MDITIKIPDDINIGGILEAQGAIINASTSFVSWEDLYGDDLEKKKKAITPAGKLLLAIAHQLNPSAENRAKSK